jgi:hypothetical protein
MPLSVAAEKMISRPSGVHVGRLINRIPAVRRVAGPSA